jgi:hypothetical protein
MSQIFNRTFSHGSVSPDRRLGTTCAMMTGVVALLVLAETTVVSAEQTPTESVNRTIDDVIHIPNNEELKQPGRSRERRQKIEQVIKQRVSYTTNSSPLSKIHRTTSSRWITA